MTQLADPLIPAMAKPVVDSIDADLLEALAAAPATLTLAAPVDALQVATDSGWVDSDDLVGAARLWNRAGGAAGDGEFRIDYGASAGAALLSDGLLSELLQASDMPFTAVYLGGLVGGRGELGYDPPTAASRGHLAHGGPARTRGVRTACEAIREQAGDLISDGPHEALLDAVDLVAQGDGWLPNHAELAEEDVRGTGGSDVDPVARHQSPSLWSIVHNERSQSGRRIMPFTRAARADSLHHPHLPDATDRWPGLTDDEWNQLLCYQVACVATSGHLPLFNLPLEYWNDRIDPDQVPTPQCVRFLRRAMAALRDTDWCAQFLAFGRAERPLKHIASRDTTANPLSWVQKINPRIVEAVGPPGMPVYNPGGGWSDGWSDGWATGAATPTTGAGGAHVAFDVPKVLASMWRDPGSTDLCLVLTNWTNAAAAWQGQFHPRRYADWGTGQFSDGWSDGWATGVGYRIDHLRSSFSAWSDGWSDAWGGAAGEEEIAAGLHGPISVECSGTAGTRSGQSIFLAAMPPYSIHAYRFRQET